MKILYILDTFPKISETFILNELIELQKQSIKVHVVAFKKPKYNSYHNSALKYLYKNDCEYLFIYKMVLKNIIYAILNPKKYFLNLFYFLILSKDFKTIICYFIAISFINSTNKYRPQHIHAHYATYPALVACIIGKILNIPYSFTGHAYDIFSHPNKKLLSYLIENSSFVATISAYNKNYLKRFSVYEHKIHIIHCGINIQEFNFIKRNNSKDLRILCIARMVKKKGIIYLLRTCKKLSEFKIDYSCTLIGNGPLYEEFKQYIQNNNLTNNVFIKGEGTQTLTKTELIKATLFVLPCVTEPSGERDGIPVSLMEAMACGLPVISTRISGIPELIINGYNGYLVQPRNVDMLFNAIINLNNKDVIKNARQTIIDNFNIEKEVHKLILLFKKSDLLS